jgi:carboxylesterase type B
MIEDSCAKWQDTCHGTDLMLTFGIPLRYSQKFSDEEKKLSIKMIDTFIHFAKKGSKNFF